MNKLVIALLISLTSFTFSQMNAQQFQVGLKGGINKTSGGEITGINSGLPAQYTSDTFDAVGEIGFHGGGWVQVNFGKFFVRPELVYSKLESRFDFPQGPTLFEVEEFSAPLLIGYNIYGPLDFYGGVAYKNIISSTIERIEPTDNPAEVVIQNTPFSAQVGVKAQFGFIGVDVRYDYALSSAEPYNVDFQSDDALFNDPTVNRATLNDLRLNQIIVSLTVKLWDSENKGKRRKGGSCYF
ncbi:outer membrane beta-barrel protein [Gillisia sp. CAL575]|uniref:outer membrane beta-barrel protein n=1 Tax=Gillisia sp. CAL575 TaxID=985255 RepID=UPI000550300F|nr:outer membrane beta-barrel protein [Gillisia sp. CAL575]